MEGSNKQPYPKCICGHGKNKHEPHEIDEFNVIRIRGKCRVKGCVCYLFIEESKGE